MGQRLGCHHTAMYVSFLQVTLGSCQRSKGYLVTSALLRKETLKTFIIQQLDAIEPGLHLVKRQLSTPAGRLDLLCKDVNGNFVVVELKRMQGSDQVVGQILRYMGWLKETHRTEKVRGIIIVGRKDQALLYAVMGASNVQVKEFQILIK